MSRDSHLIKVSAAGIRLDEEIYGAISPKSLRKRPSIESFIQTFIEIQDLHQDHLTDHRQQMASTYRNYMSYVPPQYYGMPPQYNNGAMPSQAPYQTYGRSPPPMRQYAPMMGVSVPQSYARHYEQFPSLATSYQPPPTPASVPIHPRTPSSTHSSTLIPPSTPIRQGVDRASCQLALPPAESPVLSERPPFRPPVSRFFCSLLVDMAQDR